MDKVKNDCFGVLDKIFPVGGEGLREIIPDCFDCPDRVSCLKTALSTEEGIEMQEMVINRNADSGLIGRLQRWSRKKELNRLKEQEKNRGK